MAGVGRRGPAPKDPDVRLNPNATTRVDVKVNAADLPDYIDSNPTPPEPNEKWHPVARQIYDGLLTDPARLNMTSGDWALSMMAIENISRDLKPQVVAVIPGSDGVPGDVVRDTVAMNGSRLNTVLKWAMSIGLTDAARRSMGIHLRLGVSTDDLNGPTDGVVLDRAELFLAKPEDEKQ